MTPVRENAKRCVLTVDDDRILLALLKSHLQRAGYEVMQARSAEQALEAIALRVPDLAVLDIALPGMSGLDLARRLRHGFSIPFMFLSSYQTASLVRQAAQEGAIGYFVKPVYPTHLIPAIEAALTRAEEIRQLRSMAAGLAAALASRRHGDSMLRRELGLLTERLGQAQKRMEETDAHARKLQRLAHEDTLTGLYNRAWLMDYLPAVLQRARAGGGPFALLYLDLDGFKKVNDSLGHAAGDELLRAAALRMKSALKPGDCIVRYGGDEFIILIEHLHHEGDAAQVAGRMADVLGEPFELFAGGCAIGVSIGISLFPRDGDSHEALLQNADLALYRAKAEGKGRHRFYHPGLARLA